MKLKDFDFRIWDNIEKKYVKTPHGLYIENTEHNDASSYSRIIGNYEQRSFYIDYPFNDRNNEYYDNEGSLLIELFTGLYDKKGNKIYEGDILYSFEGCSEGEAFKYKAVLKEGAFYLVECGDDGEEYDEDLISEFRLEELEIVGNIHENADLLVVKE
ncbi:YopX family protein [Campylobacter coli]